MRAAVLSLLLIATASAQTIPLGESLSDLDRCEIQGGNGGDIDPLNRSNEPGEANEEVTDEISLGEDLVIESASSRSERQRERERIRLREQRLDLIRVAILNHEVAKLYDQARQTTADPSIEKEDIFTDSPVRYRVPEEDAQWAMAHFEEVLEDMRRSGQTVDEGVVSHFAGTHLPNLEDEMRAIVRYALEIEQSGVTGQAPQQLLALAEDQVVVIAIYHRLNGVEANRLASIVKEQNPFLTDMRAEEIASRVERQYAPPQRKRNLFWK